MSDFRAAVYDRAAMKARIKCAREVVKLVERRTTTVPLFRAAAGRLRHR
jgi:hypothetical protein